MPELAGLSGNALIQAVVFHQFALLLLLVPVVAATALATHAVVGEKQAKALEPLLATPISTIELLAAKTLTPFVFALSLTWLAAALYVAGIVAFGEPGVWRVVLGMRTLVLFVILGPLVELAALQVSVITSSRAHDPRSAQQLTALLILPITAVFVAQLLGAFVVPRQRSSSARRRTPPERASSLGRRSGLPARDHSHALAVAGSKVQGVQEVQGFTWFVGSKTITRAA